MANGTGRGPDLQSDSSPGADPGSGRVQLGHIRPVVNIQYQGVGCTAAHYFLYRPSVDSAVTVAKVVAGCLVGGVYLCECLFAYSQHVT